jgi:hypothetical protein
MTFEMSFRFKRWVLSIAGLTALIFPAFALETKENVIVKGGTISINLGVPLTPIWAVVPSPQSEVWHGVQIIPATEDVADYLTKEMSVGQSKTCSLYGTDVYTANVRGVNTVSRMVYRIYGCR